MNYIRYLDHNRKIVFVTEDFIEERFKSVKVNFKDTVECWMIYNAAQKIKEEEIIHLP